MSTTPFALRYAAEDDVPSMVRLATDAFNASGRSIDDVVFPKHLRTANSEQDIFNWRVRSLRSRLLHHDVVVVVRQGEDGGPDDVAGWAEWQKPVEPGHEHSDTRTMTAEQRVKETIARIGPFPDCIDHAKLKESGEVLDRARMEALGEEGDKHMWTLQSLAVDIRYHRQGVGSMLVRWGLEKAQAEGKDLHLLATEDGRRLYLSLGFEDLKVPPVDYFTKTHYLMTKRVAA
ncbi:acyl-CoA N-acyltransferase [Apodospora peruviana]|uniref:Acyl-CoA N-acyltransferase n=1 Tax=Apodospora peruviana TaxID=516989 RepID=A0AAE0ITU2_9PEZI|nr:acyl-CoA N-acyltransferase [Apodospora peruviana]